MGNCQGPAAAEGATDAPPTRKQVHGTVGGARGTPERPGRGELEAGRGTGQDPPPASATHGRRPSLDKTFAAYGSMAPAPLYPPPEPVADDDVVLMYPSLEPEPPPASLYPSLGSAPVPKLGLTLEPGPVPAAVPAAAPAGAGSQGGGRVVIKTGGGRQHQQPESSVGRRGGFRKVSDEEFLGLVQKKPPSQDIDSPGGQSEAADFARGAQSGWLEKWGGWPTKSWVRHWVVLDGSDLKLYSKEIGGNLKDITDLSTALAVKVRARCCPHAPPTIVPPIAG